MDNANEKPIPTENPFNSSPPPPTAPPVSAPVDGGYEEESGGKKKLFLIIGAVVFFILLIILSIIFIVPRFSNNSSGPVTITYWGVWQDEQVFKEIIADFERENPDIKVKYEPQDIKTLGKFIERLTTRIQNGSGPDVFRFHNSWTPQLKGYLLPVPQNVVQSTGLDTQYYSTVSKDLKVNGAYYGVPLQVDTLALFVNNEIFQAANEDVPTNWNDLVSVSRRLTVPDPETGKIVQSGVALGTYDNVAHSSDIISLLLIQNGADLNNLSGPTRVNAEQALDFYTCFARNEGTRCKAVWDSSMENSKLAFSKGKVAMYFGYSWDIFEIKAINPELDFSVWPAPMLLDRDETIASYWAEGVSSQTKAADASFKFVEFVGKKQNMEKLYTKQSQVRAFGELYPRTDMAALLKDNKLIYPFVEQADNAVSTPFASDTYDDAMNTSLNGYLGNAIRSMLTNNVSPASAIDTLSQGVAQVMANYAR